MKLSLQEEIAKSSTTNEYMAKEIDRLKKMVDCLCITNFLTEHKDGDEKAREDAVMLVNRRAREAKDRYKAYDEYRELYFEVKDLRSKMEVIEQDYPDIKQRYKELMG